MNKKSFISCAFMVPNDLIDNGYMAQMKGPALACYMFIVRKTRGWNKCDDSISVSQLTEGTGYNKDSVLKGADKLVEMGVIERKSFKNQPAKYVLTDAILAVDFLDSENIAGENIECAVENIDSTHSKISTHNNNYKTTNTKTNIYKAKFDFAKALLENGVDQKLITEFMEVRKIKKAVNSETAFKSLISEQQKSGLNLNQVIEHCVVNSWKGFKAEWVNKSSSPTTTSRNVNDAWGEEAKYNSASDIDCEGLL